MNIELRKAISEEVLRHAVIACFEREMASLPTNEKLQEMDLETSERHKKRMKKLFMSDKLLDLRKKVAKSSTRAAIIVLAFISVIFFVLLTNSRVRAAVSQTLIEWYEKFTRFSSVGTSTEKDVSEWHPSYLPEGFDVLNENTYAGVTAIDFANNDDIIIRLEYSLISNGMVFNVDNEYADYEIYTRANIEYHIFRSNSDEYTSKIIWKEGDYDFFIQSTFDVDELILIASSMKVE